MDKQIADLKAACEKYKAQAPAAGPVGVLDWAALLTIVPVLLQLFVKDSALREVITQVINLLAGLFKK